MTSVLFLATSVKQNQAQLITLMKRYKLKYTGGFLMLLVLTFFALTVILIPAAVIILINDIEIIEV